MKYPIAVKTNLILYTGLLAANLFLLFGLPFLLKKNFLWIFFAFPIVICSNTYWSLIHEGIHFLFHPNKKINEGFSRVLALFFGCSFNVLRIGHLMHHRFNRSTHDRPEVYESNKHHWLSKTIHYYWFLMNGLYFIELFLPLISFLPQKTLLHILENTNEKKAEHEVTKHLQKQLTQPRLLNKIRLDTSLIILIYLFSFIAYGKFFWILLGILLIRGFLISMADNLPHYGTPIDDKYFAYNLAAPSWLEFLLLNFNYHQVHHKSPNIPWNRLPKEFSAKGFVMNRRYFNQWRNQFHGLIPIERIKKEVV